MYYRNAQAALVAYDLTKPSSLIKARHWVAELQRQASPGIVIALAGNKYDLVEESAAAGGSSEGDVDDEEGDLEGAETGTAQKKVGGRVSTKEAKAFAEEEGLLYFETSAKTGKGVAEVFTAIANAIPEAALNKGRGVGAAAAGAGGRGQGSGAASGGRGGDEGSVQLPGLRSEQGGQGGCAC